jgi:hypothetical protein
LARSAVLIQFPHDPSVLLDHITALMTTGQVFLEVIVRSSLTRRN